MQAPRRSAAQEGVPGRVDGDGRQHLVEVLAVDEGVLQLAAFVERQRHVTVKHAAHHEAVLPLGVPHGRWLGQQSLHVVSGNEDGSFETHRNIEGQESPR